MNKCGASYELEFSTLAWLPRLTVIELVELKQVPLRKGERQGG